MRIVGTSGAALACLLVGWAVLGTTTLATAAPSSGVLGSGALSATTPADDPCTALNEGRVRYSTGAARHVLFAVADAYGSNHVTITECVRKGFRWKTTFTTQGRAGEKGFAAPGEKREGDGKSPTGSYTMTKAFGVGNPGTPLPYRKLRPTNECWGSTSTELDYNQYYRGNCRKTDENLSEIMAGGLYKHSVVINYNRLPDESTRPYGGSAIFLHIAGKGATAGCVSMDEKSLVHVMRTLRPLDRMIMGTQADLFKTAG